MSLYFVTANQGKLKEAQKIIPEIKPLEIDLPEIQEIDAHKIIQAKLKEALKYKKNSALVIEDTSLYLDCLNGLPGPLIKWFLKSLGVQGLFDIARRFNNYSATAQTIIGYISLHQKTKFFQGKLKGKIVSPRGENGFGWDSIFQPYNYSRTLAEMSLKEKNEISMRQKAFQQLKNFLEQ